MEKNLSDTYAHFTEKDFFADPYFQEWVYNPTDEIDSFWKEISAIFPDKKTDMENARTYLNSISFKVDEPSEDEIEASLQKHLQAVQGLQSAQPAPVIRRSFNRNLTRVAAIFGGVVLLTASYFIFLRKPERLVASTKFGENKHVVLPDGSVVDLNANSSITYNKEWKQGEKREVWLNGEAYFDVKHINKDTNDVQPREQFLVHTKDVTVTVLGTTFDIRQRRLKTEVVLQSGKIKLSFADGTAKEMIMQPGELVSYDETDKKVSTQNASAEQFTAWKQNKLILVDPTVGQILAYLEDNFGKKIVVENPGLNDKVINGPILLSSLDDALFVLSTVLNTEVIKSDSTTILLRSR